MKIEHQQQLKRSALMTAPSKKHPALIGLTLLLNGCATVVSDYEWPVTIKSVPDGANVQVTNKAGSTVYTGTTPATVFLKGKNGYFSGETYTVNLSKPEYSSTKTLLNADINPWYWGNFAIGGLVGFLLVDPITGAMWKLPESISVPLDRFSADIPLKPTAFPNL